MQCLERAEFYESIADKYTSTKLSESAKESYKKINNLIIQSIKVHSSLLAKSSVKNGMDVLAIQSEMYEECDELRQTIEKFSVHWGSGKDHELFESLIELEQEIDICFEILEEDAK